tara:strand:+ start:348 stop:653 length:306 start_codon:yes stop_codon:yes gene_type:complete
MNERHFSTASFWVHAIELAVIAGMLVYVSVRLDKSPSDIISSVDRLQTEVGDDMRSLRDEVQAIGQRTEAKDAWVEEMTRAVIEIRSDLKVDHFVARESDG